MKMKCSGCGTWFESEERYCPYCYTRVNKSNSIQLDKGRYTSIKVENHTQGMSNQYSKKKSKIISNNVMIKKIRLIILIFVLFFAFTVIVPILFYFTNIFLR